MKHTRRTGRHAVLALTTSALLACSGITFAPQQRQPAPRGGATQNALTRAAPSQGNRANAGGLGNLNDDALISELASRGLDSLLDRAFDVNNVPADRRAGIKAFGALRELTDKKKPPTA